MYTGFIFVVLGCLSLKPSIYAQDQSGCSNNKYSKLYICSYNLLMSEFLLTGFISLDCGSPIDTNYTETTTTGLNYISDFGYINTGTSGKMMSEFQADTQRPYWYVRSFPDGTRNCYRFNLTKGNKYLIRANFMYGNYDGKENLPKFDLHIGPNKWETVTLTSASSDTKREIIHVLTSSLLYLCLVKTGSGTPFVSTVEIRLLKSTIYNTQVGSLNDFVRFDVGPTLNTTIRSGFFIFY